MTEIFARIITAVILVPLVILGIFYLPPLFFLTLSTLLIALAAWEMSNLFWPNKLFLRVIFLSGLFLAAFFSQTVSPFYILILGTLWWFTVPYFLVHYAREGVSYFNTALFQFISGFLTFIPCLIAIITLWFDFGPKYLLFILAIIWSADIGAYFVGRRFGKQQLAAKISPRKTIEGVIGGVGFALVIAAIAGSMLHFKVIAWVVWILLILIVVLWSVIGDLFKSMLKRIAKVKNSGNLLPGHGGLYDRIDSLTSALPIFVLGLMVFRL